MAQNIRTHEMIIHTKFELNSLKTVACYREHTRIPFGKYIVRLFKLLEENYLLQCLQVSYCCFVIATLLYKSFNNARCGREFEKSKIEQFWSISETLGSDLKEIG